jgi:UDP-N-acetylmuramoylalanine--D-glutamate ligase
MTENAVHDIVNTMNVAIVGYGAVEGKSALAYWQAKGATVTVCDQNDKVSVPASVEVQLGKDYLHDLDRFDLIVRNAGLHPRIILKDNPNVAGKITTIVDEFLRICPTKNTLGVTGTKGKGTTSMLIVKMLEAAGKHVFLGGNYGISPFDFLDKLTPDSWVVLELSSFMLYDIKHSPHIGVCLMVQPEHLDWHGDELDYYRSKMNMFAHQGPKDVAIYYADSVTSHRIASESPGDKIAYYDEPGAYVYEDQIMIDQTVLCKTSELKLLGKHNWQNVCAAVTAVWQVTQAPDAIRKVLESFTGLPHRLEFVREVDGVQYFNDSFGSDPYATEAAVDAIPGMKVVIVGGYDRMLPLKHFAQTLAAHSDDLRTVLLIGASAKRVGGALKAAGFTNFRMSPAKTMQEIITECRAHAQKGDSVVLSPGFASFDMFRNFEDRGLQFKEAVHAL